MKPNEFYNSAENLNDLVRNNGLLQNPEGLLLYRQALGHSNAFDASIIYNTSPRILDPLSRPVRRTQRPDAVRNVWNRMSQILIDSMLDRTFFGQVSTCKAPLPRDLYFPDLVERELQFNNDVLKTAKLVRDRRLEDAKDANAIRWPPPFKQVIDRNDAGDLIVAISQNSIGNAMTERLGVVVNRRPDAEAYARAEPALIDKRLHVRRRLVEADLGDGIATSYWGA